MCVVLITDYEFRVTLPAEVYHLRYGYETLLLLPISTYYFHDIVTVRRPHDYDDDDDVVQRRRGSSSPAVVLRPRSAPPPAPDILYSLVVDVHSFRSRSSLHAKRTTSARRWRHTGARAPAPRSRRLPAGLAPISVTARAADDAEKSIADTYTRTPETRAHASVAIHTRPMHFRRVALASHRRHIYVHHRPLSCVYATAATKASTLHRMCVCVCVCV